METMKLQKTRKLDPARIEAMAVARAKVAERRRADEDEQYAVFMRWLSDERKAFARLQFAREVYDPSSPEVDEAYSEWWLTYADSPQLPPDAAFRRARGEDTGPSNAS